MTRLRLAFVTRRFWPLVGGEATVVANLAVELRRLGAQPSVVTAQWDSHWPADVVCREVHVHRLAFPRHRPWGTTRYMMALSRWIRANAANFDLMCISGLGHDAVAAVSALRRTKTPVVVRAGSNAWQDTRRASAAGLAQRLLNRGRLADLFIALDPQAQRELHASGIEADRVRLIPCGVPTDLAGDAATRIETRAALAEVNADLHVPVQAPVGLYMGSLRRGNQLDTLITAWSLVAQRRPQARLWLVGDGPDRGRLFRRVQDADLAGRVIMPGSFDAEDDLLRAADFAIIPFWTSGVTPFIFSAMAARLPVIAVDSPGIRQTITPGETGTLVPADFPNIWADAIIKTMENPQTVTRMTGNAARLVQKYFSLRQMAKSHLDVFRELVRNVSARSR